VAQQQPPQAFHPAGFSDRKRTRIIAQS